MMSLENINACNDPYPNIWVDYDKLPPAVHCLLCRDPGIKSNGLVQYRGVLLCPNCYCQRFDFNGNGTAKLVKYINDQLEWNNRRGTRIIG
jgi:hypothetical protein